MRGAQAETARSVPRAITQKTRERDLEFLMAMTIRSSNTMWPVGHDFKSEADHRSESPVFLDAGLSRMAVAEMRGRRR